MDFNALYFSLSFLIFLFFYHTILKNQKLKSLLFFSSFILIYFFPLASLICFISSISTFKIGVLIQKNKLKVNTSSIYILGISFLILNLISIKYLNYIKLFNPKNSNLTQIGISFYTLQNISYLIDIKKQRLSNNNFSNFILYNIYFPRFLSGPIIQPKDFFFKFQDSISQKFNPSIISTGLNLILVGTFKKIVLSDRLSPIIEHHFSFSNDNIGLTNLIISFLFTFQLYFDFSGYTDIARGISKTLGFDLIPNFNIPLRAKSISEFWRKWHISLTSWLTNYVFYPVSFKLRKQKKLGTSIAILITFILSGLWHGFGITFIIYALFHAFYLIFEHYTLNFRNKLKTPNILTIPSTFILVSIAFIFFRAENFEIARRIFISLFNFIQFWPVNFEKEVLTKIALGGEKINLYNLYITLILCCIYLIFEFSIEKLIHSERIYIIFYIIILTLIFAFGIFGNQTVFIYNQF